MIIAVIVLFSAVIYAIVYDYIDEKKFRSGGK